MSAHQILLLVHLLSIALMIGIGFSNLVGFRVAKSLGGDMAKGIAAQREALVPYVDVLFILIIGSGLLLLKLLGGAGGQSGWFHAKLAVVAIWAITYVLMRLRIRTFLASRDMALVPRIRSFAHVLIGAATLAVVLAVMAFEV